MNDQLYNALKELLNMQEIICIKDKQCITTITNEINSYEIKNNADFSDLDSIMNDFGISNYNGDKKRSTELHSIKRAIFFNYVYNKYYGKLRIQDIADIIGINRTNCYHYLKKYELYTKFYPITKELQQEFNKILEKYEI